jgi:heterodisulfide reductase subunit A-like polyferredoxin
MGQIMNLLQYSITHPILFFYQILQYVLDLVLSPTPPPPHANLVRPKIAVIGAGLTGVSAASHIVGHGFDCRIFEAGPKEHLGGIW